MFLGRLPNSNEKKTVLHLKWKNGKPNSQRHLFKYPGSAPEHELISFNTQMQYAWDESSELIIVVEYMTVTSGGSRGGIFQKLNSLNVQFNFLIYRYLTF